MYLQLEPTSQGFRPAPLSRLAEWWPAALLGILELMGGLPDANAATVILGL